MTQPEHDRAVLAAHARYSLALSVLEGHRLHEAKLEEEVKSAEAELRALARRKP